GSSCAIWETMTHQLCPANPRYFSRFVKGENPFTKRKSIFLAFYPQDTVNLSFSILLLSTFR
ncbi:MAG TPA: hypothetical protein P5150_09995, partial [Candidatus Ratteibacteria bacterium]|nr:hypothetical protein [Candidatus Ratteibacteria bacterium]